MTPTIVKLDCPTERAGQYHGFIVKPATLEPTEERALILNTRELDSGGHALSTHSLPLLFLGFTISDGVDGVKVVIIDGSQAETCP